MFPNSENYYFAPLQKQAKEIVWASQRLQSFGPRDWLVDGSLGINNTEMRLRFKEGSFIKMDGSDNIDSYRGVKPRGLVVYDEYKDFREGFHLAFEPNLDAHDAPLIVVGTPPEEDEHHFYALEDEFRDDPEKAVFEFTSYDNPHNDKRILDKRRKELDARGEVDVFEREYLVKKVYGGKNSIFPMIDVKLGGAHYRPHDQIISSIKRDWHKLDWYYISDAGTTTVSAHLFCAINPHTKKLYLLDCIYEEDQRQTSTSLIGKRIIAKKSEYYQKADWTGVYDEAAAWFYTEMLDQFDEAMTPTHKSINGKEDGISLIKDILLYNMVEISDRCEPLMSEMKNYIRDEKGKIPKGYDHLIDCFRYFLGQINYNMKEVLEARNIESSNKEEKPYYSISDDFDNKTNTGDHYDDLFDEF